MEYARQAHDELNSTEVLRYLRKRITTDDFHDLHAVIYTMHAARFERCSSCCYFFSTCCCSWCYYSSRCA
ncbi:hypothetical protein AB672_01225 [Xylella taiwanensis]|nr:hypothetical protein AB672_01225 [Xylella taiwanensis]